MYATASGITRCMERSLPTNCSRSFQPIRRSMANMASSWVSSWSFCSVRATVPASVLIFHPMNCFTKVQSPSPEQSSFNLTKYFISPDKDGKIHSWARTVPSKT